VVIRIPFPHTKIQEIVMAVLQEVKVIDLIGHYSIIAGEKFGRPDSEERLKGSGVRFTEKSVTVYDPDKNETYGADYELDCSETPCRITMKATKPDSGEVAYGLIERSGDTVRLIYSLPGEAKPTSFSTAGKQLMFVMEKSA